MTDLHELNIKDRDGQTRIRLGEVAGGGWGIQVFDDCGFAVARLVVGAREEDKEPSNYQERDAYLGFWDPVSGCERLRVLLKHGIPTVEILESNGDLAAELPCACCDLPEQG